MTAFEELETTGVVGAETIALLVKLIRQVAGMNSFPPPPGYDGWTSKAAESYLGTITLTKGGGGFIIQCALRANDQVSLERLLMRAIKNALIDEAKSTPVGRLRRRMQGLLAKDQRFVNAKTLLAGDDGWTVSKNVDAVWIGDIDGLQVLTASVEVDPIDRLNRGGPTPPAARASLLTMSYEAISRAAGAIRSQLLSRFLVQRFELDAPASPQPPSENGELSAAAADPETLALARTYFDDLSNEDREVLRDPSSVASRVENSEEVELLVLRLRAWSGSELGRDAVGLVVSWCAEPALELGRPL